MSKRKMKVRMERGRREGETEGVREREGVREGGSKGEGGRK